RYRASRNPPVLQIVVAALAPVRVEMPGELVAVAAIVLLESAALRGELRDALREACLEHERQRAFELVRLEVGVARLLEGVHIRSVRQHRIVQGSAAGDEAAARLRVILAVYEAHEL